MTYQPVDHVAIADARLLHQFKVGDPPFSPEEPTIPAPTVTRDGPSNVYVPQAAEDFQRLGIVPPTFLWLCGEASGSLMPSIGTVPLVPGGTGHVYRQALAGWARSFVGFAEGANARFATTDAGLDLAVGESFAVLVYAAVADASAGTRGVLQAQGSNNDLRISTAGVPTSRHGGAVMPVMGDHGDAGSPRTVRPWLWYRNGAANESGAKTDLAEALGTHDEGAVVGANRGLGANGLTSANLLACLVAIWKGPSAEQNWKTVLRALAWPLAYA